jgi:hypothetical protein
VNKYRSFLTKSDINGLGTSLMVLANPALENGSVGFQFHMAKKTKQNIERILLKYASIL